MFMLRAYTKSFVSDFDESEDLIPWECLNEVSYEYPEDEDYDDVIII